MQRTAVTKWLIAGLLVVAIVQAFWIFSPAPQPALSKIISMTPIGTESAIYEVLSNSGGATVPMTYVYFVAARQPDENLALKLLKDRTPFLITRQAGAVTGVEGLKITVRTHDRIYSFHNSSLLRENGEIKPVTIDLTATSD